MNKIEKSELGDMAKGLVCTELKNQTYVVT